MSTFSCKRIVVVGATSSGKSTLAEALSKRLGYEFIELDALHWGPSWTPADTFTFWERVEGATDSDAWVVAGNYSRVRDLIWSRAEAVIWLDYPLPIVFWRLLVRTVRRAATQEELWNGNRERFWWHFKLWSDESLFHWLFKTYWRRKREIPLLLSLPKFQHLRLIHFKHPRETERWLENLPAATEAIPKENR
jgi:adenylate kinase family enzyme